jgi:DNA-binding NtrC family response regulator
MTDSRAVLIVHRDPAVRARLASILEGAGLRVTTIAQPPAETAAGDQPAEGRAVVAGADLVDAAIRGEMTLRELSDLYTARILDRVNGNKVRAARILGINRRTLYRRGEARRRDAALRAAGDNRERERDL